MPDTLTTVTNLINSPAGQLVAGGVLAGIVWKFFERVEAVLNEDTKLEIAVWLLDREPLSPTFQSWPDTFARVFDRVFGNKHLSWKCCGRSALATYLTLAVGVILIRPPSLEHVPPLTRLILFGMVLIYETFFSNVVPDYFCLLKTRFVLDLMRHYTNT